MSLNVPEEIILICNSRGSNFLTSRCSGVLLDTAMNRDCEKKTDCRRPGRGGDTCGARETKSEAQNLK